MSTGTLLAAQRGNCVFARNLGDPTKMYAKTNDKGVKSLIIEGKPIFRSGKFSDSRGIEHEWETLHMNQMVDHFNLLSSREIFQDVPVRKGHPDWGGLFSDPVRNAMDELIGYMSNFRTEERRNPADGQTYTYFLADLEILDEEAIKKIESGLWRNVSAEISTYVTNSNAEYWPVMMGVAYVDQPAVEGLKSQHSKAGGSFSLILEDKDMEPQNPNPPLPNQTSEHTKKQEQQMQEFSIGGKATSDYAAVQAHITRLENENASLEQFRTESLQEGRANFVKGLVRDNKIAASQEEGYIGFAKGATDEAFASWKALMEAAPVMAHTAPQGAGFSSSVEQMQNQDGKADRITVLRGIVANHSNRNTSREAIMEMGSYKELVALDPTFQL